MLNIYIGRKSFPEGSVYLNNPDSIVDSLDLMKDQFTAEVLRDIEKATPYARNKFYDRFGGGLYAECLSTTTKIILGLHQTDIVLNACELGINGYNWLSKLKHGNVFLECPIADITVENFPVSVNGIICSTEIDFDDAMEEAGYEIS